MYDIKIFMEENGQFGARINAGKEVIYGVGNNYQELMDDLEQGLKISFQDRVKSEKVSKLFSFFNSNNKKDLVCH